MTDDKRPAGNGAPSTTNQADTTQCNAVGRHDLSGALRRRRAASSQLPPLGSCGCIRDPVHDWHHCGATEPKRFREERVSDRWADAGAAAAAHLLELGFPPILDRGTLHGLWRRDRVIAQRCYDLVRGD